MANEPAPDESPTDIVLIIHPDFEPSPPARVSREAFETNYTHKGFVLCDDNGEPLAAAKKSTAKSTTSTSSSASTGGGASA